MILGLAGLSLAWRYASTMHVLPSFLWKSIAILTSIIWLFFIIGYIIKWKLYQKQAKEELQDQVLCCFISLIPITTMLMGIFAIPYMITLAKALIFSGTIGQLLFSAYRHAGLWRGTHDMSATTPIIYLPSVASNFISSIALVQLGFNTLPWLFFGAGLFSWISIESAILQRLRNLSPITAGKRTILGIQLAPAFVAGNTYLQLQHYQIDVILFMFIGYGLLQFIYLIRLSKWIFESSHIMGSWAFSFGLASMALLGMHLAMQSNEVSIIIIGWFMWIAGSLSITLLLIISIRYFCKTLLFKQE